MFSHLLAPRLRYTVGRRSLDVALDRKLARAECIPFELKHLYARSPSIRTLSRSSSNLSQHILSQPARGGCDWFAGQSWQRLQRPHGCLGRRACYPCFKANQPFTQTARYTASAKAPDDSVQKQTHSDSKPRATSHVGRDSEQEQHVESKGDAQQRQSEAAPEIHQYSYRAPREDIPPQQEAQENPDRTRVEALRAQLEAISKLYRRSEISNAALAGGVSIIVIGAGALILNWQNVRQHVSKESAGMVSETIRDKQLQYDAHQFSKELLNHLLTDEEVSRTVARWTYGILQSLKNEIGDLFVHILALEQVVAAVNRLADRLVEYLCSSRTIQERVGKLLIDAICLDYSRDAAARWAVDLVLREDVKEGFRDLVVAALQTDDVVNEARSLAIQIVNTVLNDPYTQSEARRTLNETLRDSELRATAKDSLWSIVMPWSGHAKAADKVTQKALKSLEDVLALENLTQEEKHVLRSLQNRLRNGGDSANAEEVPVASEKEEAERAALQQVAKEKAQLEAKEKIERDAKERAEREAAEEAAKKAAAEKAAKEKAEREAEEAAEKAAEEKAAKEKVEREAEEAARKAAEEKAAKEKAEREAEEAAEEKAAKEKAEREAEEAARKAAEEKAAKEKAELEAQEAARRAAEERAANEKAEREAQEAARKAAEETAIKEKAEREAVEAARKAAEEQAAKEEAARKAMEEKAAREKAEQEAELDAARRLAEAKAAAEKKTAEEVSRKLANEAAEQAALARQAEERVAALKANQEEGATKEIAEQVALAREAEDRASALKEVAEEAAKEVIAHDRVERNNVEVAANKPPEKPSIFRRIVGQAAQIEDNELFERGVTEKPQDQHHVEDAAENAS